MNPKFWNGKRVFLTGHTGFKGSWLSLWLQSLGAEVTGYALNPPTNPSLFEKANVAAGMRSIIGDVRDLCSLQKAMLNSNPEIVIHMAAQALVRYSYANPVDTFATNVMGSVNLLEATRNTKSVKVLVNVTSDKCYENRDWIWGYRENEAMGGYDPYSNSKGCAELVTAAYRSSFFNPKDYHEHGVAVASVRAGNVIGGGDWAEDRLIPDLIRAITSKTPIIIRNPNAVRPWQFVLEPLNGYLILIEKLFIEGPAFAEAWNFGPFDQDTKPVKWIVDEFVAHWNDSLSWQIDSQMQRMHEANYLMLDCSKARRKLSWSPLITLPEAISAIVDWYQACIANEDMRLFTISQISKYQSCFQDQ
jgi:CDP-glucose 4,6-dehydratase